ncbi:MAG: D-tyrosyl-tRNA(Tyr) deacylase [Dehalococcoidia bacterium]|nr:D-tyrosyl-tRNA(Tyr) deacylase [Dehalococcoidia bacterium]
MRAVLQRVTSALVEVDSAGVGAIGPGLLVYVGVARADGEDDARWLAGRIAGLRLFPDGEGRFERSLLDHGGAALVVSQFTLLADTRRGRRPSFLDAAPPQAAEPLIERLAAELRARGVPVENGRFGAHMRVQSENDGPVTIQLDSADRERPRRLAR